MQDLLAKTWKSRSARSAEIALALPPSQRAAPERITDGGQLIEISITLASTTAKSNLL